VAEARNQADSLVHSTERQLSEHGDKVTPEVKAEIEAAIADLKGVLDGGDADALTAKTTALGTVAMKLGEAVYAAEQASAASPEAEAPKDDNVVDAEFSEVEDDKK
jgi:molecular chaperone DnaK